MSIFDMLLANAMGESGGGGGGGSSDYSTAQVTVIPSGGEVEVQMYNVANDDSSSYELPVGTVIILSSVNYYPTETTTYETVLYEGKSYLVPYVDVASISGDIVLLDENYGLYEITGDCTITLTP